MKMRPAWRAVYTRILYAGSRCSFGKGYRCDTVPKITVDKGCKLIIGNNVTFRRSVEIRVHKGAKVLIGDNCRIDRSVRLLSTNGSTIELQAGVRVGLNTVFNGGDDIFIGEGSLVSGFVYLQTSNHAHDKGAPIQDAGFYHAPIRLEKNSWLGTHVVILPGVTVGEGSVAGGNAVVTKDVPPYTVVGGVPAKILSQDPKTATKEHSEDNN